MTHGTADDGDGVQDVDWPPFYVDPDTGEQHDWDAIAPPDPDSLDDGTTLTYRQLVAELAAAQDIPLGEYLHGETWDEKLSPPWVDDGDTYGT